jgi:hypothetical protein
MLLDGPMGAWDYAYVLEDTGDKDRPYRGSQQLPPGMSAAASARSKGGLSRRQNACTNPSAPLPLPHFSPATAC